MNKANVLLGLSAGLMAFASKRQGGQNTQPLSEVKLQIIHSPLPPLKDMIGTVDRWMNKLRAIPMDQRLVMEKTLRQLPTDTKGRITREQVARIFTENNLPYSIRVLREKVENLILIYKYPALEKALNDLMRFYIDNNQNPRVTKEKLEGLRHNMIAIVSEYLEEKGDYSVIDSHIHILNVTTDINMSPDFHYYQQKLMPLKHAVANALRDVYEQTAGLLQPDNRYGEYGLSTIVSPSNSAEEVEVLLIPDLDKLFIDPKMKHEAYLRIGHHFLTEKPIFWFRGLIWNDILFVQEFQNDNASDVRGKKANKYRYNLTLEDGLLWRKITPPTIDEAHEYVQELEFQGYDYSEAEEERIIREFMNNDRESMSGLGFQLPPTDWLRSDILMVFAYAASIGISRVAFCSSEASLATVGGKEEGQRKFYDVMVPERVKSIAKKYKIKASGRITLPTNSKKYPTVTCSTWTIPPKTMQFFRQKGFPLFG